jgi:hypothetical protein
MASSSGSVGTVGGQLDREARKLRQSGDLQKMLQAERLD